MGKFNGKITRFAFMISITGITLCTIPQTARCQAVTASDETVKEGTYQEVSKDGRLYIFVSSKRKEEFEKTGELGKGIIKIGYGPNGETVVFDSEEAVIEYESRLVKELLGKTNIKAYKEFKIDGRLYVFTSPARKAEFEKTGEMGKSIVKIGYGPNGETAVFDSDEAVKEYDKRHSKK
ncbi:MAG: hypothetical protein DWB56_16465 [Candidatus Jettenia sp.]|uniref:Uncharacterized protein n=1 Tax=Candidatus Jettenia caeni TaxID=247490 RepID=I3IHJ2_9BACT|nr:hypothetical protein [Candidatus Jettenia sp. AMX1]MBC6930513.1 hypothetical protein [Candidatus Jettenia sp.]NUN23218.1 hypothetical protein [Candidatus Jettenia caeni]KAA0246969.1 MAG: hypothetical protein EDM77_16030 [Candidatus Jettenia sp. AMX1]MCE7882129.1 hypothetical protein [Candidatus Jettenia sp. AMX1]MCQ3928646.1 hypothetical protein [Candidatus Jettenia sp.]